ncbi:ATP-dependent DNA helicase RecQ [Lampropedia hyalina DSM 16112]|jgi:ATP-dependent DNA helicase RecQ|uniref:DNA helicase RecQ n=1 Tax=Lampropedia hyalina DSM 16112 TaxID=1122156 RepID=A0A1M4YZI7_9BURK|nr:DNA helicase RecQ [Lampropedia hyalina]SHF11118.1 ATP-dependent DNA helicase RecQ [Lampropedia hyalina DSM 16112]
MLRKFFTVFSSADAATRVLQETFGYPRFRGLQQDIVNHVIAGDDALVLMPTGGGKSLCYQIPALVRQQQSGGITLVISPLIALMHDQVRALHEVGVAADFLNSSQNLDETRAVERRVRQGDTCLLYAAPERVNTARFLELLDDLYAQNRLALFAIDEAHCVSQWGHDFRPEYRQLTLLHQRYHSVPRIALTATADALTRADIIERLHLQEARLFVSSFDRPNIRYQIVEKNDARKQLLQFIGQEHEGEAGIIYCQSRKKVEDTAEWLCMQGIDALPYHAGLPAATRQQHQERFLREDGLVMTATIAFGMGIDKPDVRFVAHLDLPKNIEGYYQETGRAGRDGEAADAWMAYGLADVINQRRMIDESPASEDYKQVMRGKLDALLALAEAADCRRQRLLAYFGEASEPCGNCDNCLHPPSTWDATQAAQKLLSCIYRVQKMSGITFGAGHLIDILRGKSTDKMAQFGHETLSTFGIGSDLSEIQWRSVVRQLLAMGALRTDASAFNTLQMTPQSRDILQGAQTLTLRTHERPARTRRSPASRTAEASLAKTAALADLDAASIQRFHALRVWRGKVAQQHNLPAFVIFHDSTLRDIAHHNPPTPEALAQISGIGQKKLMAYGEEVLRVCQRADAEGA